MTYDHPPDAHFSLEEYRVLVLIPGTQHWRPEGPTHKSEDHAQAYRTYLYETHEGDEPLTTCIEVTHSTHDRVHKW